jgi:tungstate transport system substrate-binding protein
VDVIFVHDPAREEKFVADGFGTKRYYVMYNDFLIIGPAADPAGAKRRRCGRGHEEDRLSEAVFVSRGDDSGTHAKEQELWKAAGLPSRKKTPSSRPRTRK